MKKSHSAWTKRRTLAAMLVASLAGSLPTNALAIDKETTGTELTTGASWVGGTVPGNSAAAVWTASSLTGDQTVATPVSWGSMSFANTTALSLTGSPITLTGASTGFSFDVFTQTGAGTLAIANDLTFSGVNSSATISPANATARIQLIASGGGLTLGNLTVPGGAQVNDANLIIRGTTTGVINGNLNVDGQVFKADAGTWTLNGNNTLGWFTINNGTILAGNNNVFGTGKIYITSGGSSMTLASTDATARTFANDLDFSVNNFTATANFGQTTGGTGLLTFNGNVILGTAARNIAANVNTTFSGPMTSSAAGTAFTKSGAANLSLTGDLSGVTGSIAVSAGTLTVNTANLHGGGYTLSGTGTLSLLDNTTHGATKTLTFNGGGIASSDATPHTISNPLAFTGNAVFGLTTGGTGELTVTSNIDLAATSRTFTANVPTTLSGAIVSTAATGLTKAGAANLTLTGNLSGITGTLEVSAGLLTVNTANLHGGGYTLSGTGVLSLLDNTTHGASKTLTFNGGGIASSDATARTVNNPLAFTGNAVFGLTTGGTGALTLTSDGALGAATRTLTVNADTTLSGALTSTATASIIKSGAANLTLSGNLSGVAGTITVNGGTLLLNPSTPHAGGIILSASGTLALVNNTAHGSSNTITFAGGTLASSDATPRTISNNFTYTNASIFGQTTGGTGDLTLNGNVNLGGSTRTMTTNANLTINGNVSNLGTGSLNKAGNSNLTLAGTANVIPNLAVNAGEVLLSGNITGVTDFTKTGTGLLTMTGDMSGISGAIIVNGGTLVMNPSALQGGGYTLTSGALSLINNTSHGATKTLTFNGGGIASSDATARTVNNPLAFTGNAVFGLTTGGTGALTVTSNGDLGAATRTLTANVETTLTGALTSTATASIVKNGNSNLTLTGNLSGVAGSIAVSAGTLTLNPSTAHSGGIILNTNGTLALVNNTAHGTSNTLTFAGGTLASSDATPRAISNPLTLTGNPIFGQTTGGTGALSLSSNIDTAATTRTLTANVATTLAGNYTTTAGLTKAGTADLILAGTANSIPTLTVSAGSVLVPGNLVGTTFTKSGAGNATLTGGLSGVTGDLIVTAGTLTVNTTTLQGGNYLLTGGALTFANNTGHGNGKTLTFNGGAIASTDATPRTISNPLAYATTTTTPIFGQTSGGTGMLTITSDVSLGGVARTFTANADTIFTGNITNTGTGAFTKNGPANLTLAGSANSIPGDITVSAGTLTLASANPLITSRFNANAGILAVGNDGAFGNAIIRFGGGTVASADAAARTLASGKTIDYAAGSSFGTATTGNLKFTDAVNLGAAQKTATVNNAITEFSGNITSGSSTNSFDKAGPGTLILSGTNAFSNRPVNVSAGTLLVNGTLTSGGVTTVNGGALGGTGVLAAAVVVNGAGTLAPGASIESLGVNSLTMASGSTYGWEAANASATGADLLTVTGTLSISGVTLGLDPATLAALGSNTWNTNDKLTLINYGGTAITSGFTGYADDTPYAFGSNLWLLNYNDTTGGLNFASDATAANFVTMTFIAAVPEPGTVALGLFALGMSAGYGLRRRRRGSL